MQKLSCEFLQLHSTKDGMSQDSIVLLLLQACLNSLDKNISGRVFADLAETDLNNYGFVSSGFIIMRSILREVNNQQILLNLNVE